MLCAARLCYRKSSVCLSICLSVCPSVCLSVTLAYCLVFSDHIVLIFLKIIPPKIASSSPGVKESSTCSKGILKIPGGIVGIWITRGIARFPCDNTAFLFKGLQEGNGSGWNLEILRKFSFDYSLRTHTERVHLHGSWLNIPSLCYLSYPTRNGRPSTCIPVWCIWIPFGGGEVVGGQRWYHSKERWWFLIGSPLWPLCYL